LAQIADKLANSDFKSGRVEDPTKIDEKHEMKVKKYCKEFFDKAAHKHRKLEKEKAARKQKLESSKTNGAAVPATTSPVQNLDASPDSKEEGHSDDEDVRISEVENETPTPPTPSAGMNGDGLKRKRDEDDEDQVDVESEVSKSPAKRMKSASPPPPPPPPPPEPPVDSPPMGYEGTSAAGMDGDGLKRKRGRDDEEEIEIESNASKSPAKRMKSESPPPPPPPPPGPPADTPPAQSEEVSPSEMENHLHADTSFAEKSMADVLAEAQQDSGDGDDPADVSMEDANESFGKIVANGKAPLQLGDIEDDKPPPSIPGTSPPATDSDTCMATSAGPPPGRQ
jgi:[histone H3]-lysine36 N-trimethyltransferase